MRPSNRLTELTIKQSKPKDKQYKITDGEGMFLRIYPNGSKYWQLQYWFEGKQKILSLGVWPEVSLKLAREKRFEAKKTLKEDKNIGINNLQIVNAGNTLQENAKVKNTTFQEVFQEWFSRQSKNWTERHSRGVESNLKMYVLPDIGETPIASITKQDIISILRKIEAQGKYETCYRVRQKLEAIYKWMCGDKQNNC